ncbi:MAG: diguanylate cyclase [Myxococcota bacterium]|nr:diguanylate cyclase [Myxococcota bacterium]
MLVGFAANALFGFFVLSRDGKAAANRLYAAFTFLVAWWALAKFALSYGADQQEALFWYRLSGPGWLLLPPVYLQFVGAYTRRRLFGGGLTNMILPAIGLRAPELAIPFTTASAGVMAFAVIRYRFLSLTVEFAAGTIIATMPDALLVLDGKGAVTLANPAMASLTDLSDGDLAGTGFNDLCHGSPFNDDVRRGLDAEGVVRLEVDFAARDGARIPVALSMSTLRDRRGATVGYVCVAKDIRELRDLIARIEEAKRELERIAITDPLTGTFNRRYLGVRLREEFLRGVRYGVSFSVVVADIDRFKDMNDTQGHSAGDDLLRGVAATFQREVRSSDVVTRYGGDEFVLILPETSAAIAEEIADRLRKAVESLAAAGAARPVSASFGVAAFDPGAAPDCEETLLRRADAALYESKRLGRNRVTCWRAGGASQA